MGKSADLPAINEISYFLSEFAPSSAEQLAKKGVEYSGVLQIGVIGGTAKEPTESDKAMGLRIRGEILEVALRKSISKADERSEQIQNRLGNLRKLRFIAGVCSAIGAMGAAGAALLGNKQTATVVLSLFSLASNVANAASSTLVLGSNKKESDLVESLRVLARAKSFAQLAAGYLAAVGRSGFPPSELTILLKDANTQYRELNDALTKSIF